MFHVKHLTESSKFPAKVANCLLYTSKEKLYHMWVYLVKIAVTMAFCFFFVSIFSILFGNENSIVGVVAVSYTHLDVYKRQSFINAKLLEPITRLSKAMKKVSQGDFEQHLETNSRIAVSYTHLDVYKRQVLYYCSRKKLIDIFQSI